MVASIIHTGQHYDPALSRVFFEELSIPRPDYDLDVGSGVSRSTDRRDVEAAGAGSGCRKAGLGAALWRYQFHLAGALVAAKADLSIAHIEAGLRSYRRGMPEEINRVVADQLSDLLLCPTDLAIENLRKEGLDERAV